MKKWLFILGVLLWTSCFDDKGNYDYIDLGELTVDGIITDQWYELFAYSDTLKIPIEIVVMSDKDRNAPFLEQLEIDR